MFNMNILDTVRLHTIKIFFFCETARGFTVGDQDPDVLVRYHSSISAMGHESQWSGGAQVSPGHSGHCFQWLG